MHYKLEYEGPPGDVTASLLYDGVVVASEPGLADRRAAEKWADRAARDHKVENVAWRRTRSDVVLRGKREVEVRIPIGDVVSDIARRARAYVHGMSHGELAGRLKVPLGTVKSWVRRSLFALQECMG